MKIDELKKEVDIVYKRKLIFITILLLALIVVGTYTYHYFERWGYFDSVYFTVTTLTTVGYGDLNPKTYFGRLFTIFYMIFGISVALYSLSFMSSYFIESREIYWMNKLSKGKNIILRFPQEIVKGFINKSKTLKRTKINR